MKKTLAVLFVLTICSSTSFSGKKKQTEVEKYQAQLQALAQQRQQQIEIVQGIELEMIKLQAIITYLLTFDEKK